MFPFTPFSHTATFSKKQKSSAETLLLTTAYIELKEPGRLGQPNPWSDYNRLKNVVPNPLSAFTVKALALIIIHQKGHGFAYNPFNRKTPVLQDNLAEG